MALVVENGTRVTGANTYVAITTADTYWEDRNSTVWSAASDDEKQRALLDAARYIDYAYKYIGVRVSQTQAMTWPRYAPWTDADLRLVLSTEIPQRVKDAQCELALEALSGALLPTLDRGGRERAVKIGPLAVEYFGDASGLKTFPVVDALLFDLVISKTSNAVTVDAIRA